MSVFVIAEAGSNWHIGEDMDRNYKQALRLIGIAAKAGADACKFQVWEKDGVYAPGAGQWKGQDIGELFNKLVLPKEWLPDLAAECGRVGIEFMASVFSIEAAMAVDPFVKRHKIASYELGCEDLIRFCAGTGKQVIVSTGAAESTEVFRAISWLRGRQAVVMQCSAAYPAFAVEAGLRFLQDVHDADFPWDYKHGVGYSDHTTDDGTLAAVAVALGASVIEKHFTEDCHAQGPDHAFALEPDGLGRYVERVRTAELALRKQSLMKVVQSSEKPLREFAVRVVFTARPLKQAQRIRREDLVAMRPGERWKPGAIHASRLADLVGRVTIRDIEAGTLVKLRTEGGVE